MIRQSNQTNKCSNLPYKAQLHAQLGGGDKSNKLKTYQHTNKHYAQQKLKNHTITHKTICSKRHKLILTIVITCKNKMTGQGKGKGAAKDLTNNPDFVMLEMDSPPQGHKRNGGSKASSGEKRSKSATKDKPPQAQTFWLGFEAMEKIAMDEGTSLCFEPVPTHTLVKKGLYEKKAIELLKAVFSYPHVGQTLFPLTRPDGIEGQHFNITQLPFEVETDPDTGLSYDYHVAIYFRKPNWQHTHEEILALTQARLSNMKIPLGDKIAEPIAILCKNGSARHWSGTIKLHLKNPDVDGINLLKGVRPFILTLDDIQKVGKVCKSYNTIARNNMLSVKINSPSLGNITGHGLFKEVIIESFKRGQELEITGVQKNTAETWAWLVAPTPTQAEKIVKFKATFRNEIIAPTIKTGERLSITQLAKKNCVMLVLQGLKLTKTMEETLHKIKEVMGPKNISSSFFPKQRDYLHSGSVNIECLHPTVYRQFVNKTHKIHNSHVTFTPHPKSLEGTLPPTEVQQKQFGFCDINTALVNTLEAIQNAPSTQGKHTRGEKEVITELKEKLKLELNKELKEELTMEFKGELATQKEDIITTANTYAQRLNSNLHDK